MTAAEIAPGDAGGVGGEMTTDEYLATELMGWDETQRRLYDFHRGYHPTKDITQALGDGGPGTVVGKMRERGWRLQLWIFEKDNRAVFFRNFGDWRELRERDYIKADTPAAAISEAARKALEGEGR